MSAGFGARLKQFRLEAGFSQRQLAEDTGIPRNVIANWETGRRLGATLDEVKPLARVLNLHVAALMPQLDMDRAERIIQARRAVGAALWELDDALGRQRG